ncbi:MAG: heme lyase CcmF/NrfE family subunit [Lautropia sp.]|nr:MAG: heme lyase CcmF/NrfE family subunit [Pseudomonadota bacterium]MBC6959423.1 heme lyase CcmF/NrfE family subunit [Lautropia sp.]MCZ2414251.1 heme lyase CcmF/NrfE family subunit [Burkholderiales bacterium]MDL1908562.1 heme lyase CcmF/NrfE family subunit [Betaproteobacteria bacterium PRO1]MEB2335163.1 heme lyase CcmF/NrfE family subunit [Burkholderiales bacterium]
MIAELGQFALALALAVSLALGILPMTGAAMGGATGARLMAVARPAAMTLAALAILAFGLLTALFVGNDFSVGLVASHSNLSLPLHYRIAATWGSHEGSMLLWVLILSCWTGAVAVFSTSLPLVLRARILSTMGLVAAGFLMFLLFTSNPFDRLVPPPSDGRDLNPLLQDAGMVFHPPLLYMGYVGLSVAFAFSVAGLIGGRFDAAWARWARPWTTVAWCFLTLGIALGSFWAYYELGWGGWWFWDPVENASFMPWLIATALVHSLSVTEKRGTFRSWTVLLAIIGFSLSLLGTFLVRSGVLTSVHAFATDPARGVFILAFLAFVVGGSLLLFAWRAPAIGNGPGFAAVSRESLLLANNVLLSVAMAAVLLGTLYPLVLDTLGLGKISVGPPYFDAVFYPLMAPALFLMGIGPLARWKKAELPELVARLRWAFAVSVIAALLLPLAADGFRPMTSLGLMFALWIAACVVVAVRDMLRGADGRLSLRRIGVHPASAWGMHFAHLGVAVFVAGVTLVTSYESGRELRMEVGQRIEIGGYDIRFVGLAPITGPNYDGTRGVFEIRRAGAGDAAPIAMLSPEKRVYRASGMPMTEAAIDRSLLRDVYLSMGEPIGERAWVVRAHVKPFVNWIWLGCVLMAIGGFVAAADRRYRRRALERAARALPGGQPA